MSVQSLACRQLVEMVTDYLEGALSAVELKAVEDHLAACEDCERYLGQMRQVIALSRVAFDEKPVPGNLPRGMLDGLLEAFRGEKLR